MVKKIAILSLLFSLGLSFHFSLVVTNNTYIYPLLKNTIFRGKLGPQINDYIHFFNDTIPAEQPKIFKKTTNANEPIILSQANNKYKTTAFLVVKNNTIIYEDYAEDGAENIPSNSFSMAKSFVSAMIGAAIQQNKILNVNQTIGEFLPDFRNTSVSNITIEHLLWMSSGINFDEDYLNPFAFPAQSYYGKNLKLLLQQYQLERESGKKYSYQGGDTQFLAFILEAATGQRLSDFFSENIWQPIGAETQSYWMTDAPKGNAKASCCLIATARDFAKFGQLYLDSGQVNQQQIIPKWYVKQSLTPHFLPSANTGERVNYYGYQWWMGNHQNQPFFYARGILGQYIICLPQQNMVIVRLGHQRSEQRTQNHPNDVFDWIEAALQIAENSSFKTT